MRLGRKSQQRRSSQPPAVWSRSRLPRPAAIVLWIAAFSFGWAVTAASIQPRIGDRSTPMAAAVAVLPGAVDANSPALPAGNRGWAGDREGAGRGAGDVALHKVRQNAVFASARGLKLMLPHPTPVLVAFHQASKPEALALSPVGRLIANDNPGGFTPRQDGPGPGYRILSSRGRGRPATSAVDIVLPEDALITAPVSGRVVEVRQYPLYGRMLDWRVAIKPAAYPDLEVVLIHLEQPKVAVGDMIVAGDTPLGVVRLLAFTSQVDYVTNKHLPHTHIEVKPAARA